MDNIYYLFLTINVAVFLLFTADKIFSKLNVSRIPEKVLLALCFAGGGIGGMLGMEIVRHKTRKSKFKILVPLSIIFNIAMLYLYIKKFGN